MNDTLNISNKGFILIQYSPEKKQFLNKKIEFKDFFKNYVNNKFFINDFLQSIIATGTRNKFYPVIYYNGHVINDNRLIDSFDKYFLVFILNLPIKMDFRFNEPAFDIQINEKLLYFHTKKKYISNNSLNTIYNNVLHQINQLSTDITSTINGTITNNITVVNDINLQKYKKEIDTMKTMGFSDIEKIIKSLLITNGILEQAINIYMLEE